MEVGVAAVPGILFNRQTILSVGEERRQRTSPFARRGERGENERFIAFAILFLRPGVGDRGVGWEFAGMLCWRG